jgi:hypothetical protein
MLKERAMWTKELIEEAHIEFEYMILFGEWYDHG